VRRILSAAAAAAALAACAGLPPRTEILAKTDGFKAQAVAVAALTGDERGDVLAARALADAARRAGLRATSLQDPEAGLAGTAISLDTLSDPRLLAQVRAATGADAVVLLTYEAGGASIRLDALDAQSGDSVLRATLTPRGAPFADAPAAARAAESVLATLAGRPAAARLDDLPTP
jgi:hypothetical protein